MTGLGAFAMTEEGIRNFLSDMKLPKEAAKYIMEAAENRKRELLDLVRSELHLFLRTFNFSGEIQKALAGMEVDIRAKVKLNQSHRQPTVKVRHVKIKPY